MAAVQPVVATFNETADSRRMWNDAWLGLMVGMAGGLLQGRILHSSLLSATLLGAGFGLVFSKRASSAGAGLIWGMSSALLFWFLILAAGILKLDTHDSNGMLDDARGRFSMLAAYLVCLGAPVGIALAIRGGILSDSSRPRFNRSRAIVAGGLAGVVSGLIFGHWMWEGGFFPLIAGLGDIQSQAVSHPPVLRRLHDWSNIRSALPTRCSRLRLLLGLGPGLYSPLVVRRASHAFSAGRADALEPVHGCGHPVVRSTRSFLAWSMRRLIARGYGCSSSPIQSTGSRMVQDSASSALFSGELWQVSLEDWSPARSCSLRMCCRVLPT
jgi:hypothetical protein